MMPSQDPDTLRRLADAVDSARADAPEAERVRRGRGQAEARTRLGRERFRG